MKIRVFTEPCLSVSERSTDCYVKSVFLVLYEAPERWLF